MENTINVDESVEELIPNLKGLDTQRIFIENHKDIIPYLKELVKVIDSIKENCSELTLQTINQDYSFEFKVHIIKEKQRELFSQVLNLKNVNQLLSEINISMESLENILTKL